MSVYVCGCGGGRFEGKEGAGGEKRRRFVIVLQWLILVVSACDQKNHRRKTFLDKSPLKVHHKSSLLHLPPLPTTLTNPTTFTNHTHTTYTPHTHASLSIAVLQIAFPYECKYSNPLEKQEVSCGNPTKSETTHTHIMFMCGKTWYFLQLTSLFIYIIVC